jgi:hypothetical protein
LDFEFVILKEKKKFMFGLFSESCNAMHLVGGASLESFVAYFSRHVVQVITVPVR